MLKSPSRERENDRYWKKKTTPSEFQRKVAKQMSRKKSLPENRFLPFFPPRLPFKKRKILSRTFAPFDCLIQQNPVNTDTEGTKVSVSTACSY